MPKICTDCTFISSCEKDGSDVVTVNIMDSISMRDPRRLCNDRIATYESKGYRIVENSENVE